MELAVVAVFAFIIFIGYRIVSVKNSRKDAEPHEGGGDPKRGGDNPPKNKN